MYTDGVCGGEGGGGGKRWINQTTTEKLRTSRGGRGGGNHTNQHHINAVELLKIRRNPLKVTTGLSLEAGGRRDSPFTAKFFTGYFSVQTWVQVHFFKKSLLFLAVYFHDLPGYFKS